MSLTVDDVKVTPMMAQWFECKETAKEALLFFRLGDFYEAFYEDATIIAKELSLTLTERQGIAMCGVPWHTSETYIDRLIAKGYRVAIAEQMEDPRQVKGLVKRQVVRCLTPGLESLSSFSKQNGHTFFASITKEDECYGVALLDVSTATFLVFECQSVREVVNELSRFRPKEIIASRKFQEKERPLFCDLKLAISCRIQAEEEWRFEKKHAETQLLRHFNVHALDGFGLKNMHPSISAAGALLHHVKETLLTTTDHIRTILPLSKNSHMLLDRATLANLEILEPLVEGKKEQTLFYLINETKTAMGERKLQSWLAAPLIQREAILERQAAVSSFFELLKQQPQKMAPFEEALKNIRDIARLATRIKTKAASPRDFVALSSSLEKIPHLFTIKEHVVAAKLTHLFSEISTHEELTSELVRAFVEAPPLRAQDGGLFKEGYSQELDLLTELRKNSQAWLAEYQAKLREETGIKTLKVGYNKMFGYFIEVSHAQKDKMPDTFIRRQTLTNGERYITKELKEYEEHIQSADEKIAKIEEELYLKLQEKVSAEHTALLKTSDAIGELDAFYALATCAIRYKFTRPHVDTSNTLTIQEGRHPVIERLSSFKQFVPNNTELDGDVQNLMIITGPNMAGKSTYIRQVALIVILAHIGSFVPAKEAHIGIVDKLFSRIGASDDLARGQSTFMVEMAETASILNQATARSLVILDEIGRGTSTYDGISIAWAVAEYLLNHKEKRTKTLFATHYYELTALENNFSQAVNYTVAISEGQGEITFLHKIIKGKTDRSYGIHVARLAGMPEAVIKRAEELQKELEKEKKQEFKPLLHTEKAPPVERLQKEDAPKKMHVEIPDLFSKIVLDGIKKIDMNTTTPVDAFTKILEWKKLLQ
jgi:DNA mismatch repair protein MutS